MKNIVLGLAMLVSLTMIGCCDTPTKKGDLHIYTVDNTDGKITAKMLEAAIEAAGFRVGLNSDIDDGLTQMFKEDYFKLYSTISIYHEKLSMDILKVNPDAGVFLPMGLAIYQTHADNNVHIAVVTAAAQAKIAGGDEAVYTALETAIAKMIIEFVPKAKHSYNNEGLKETRTLLTKFSLDLKGADWEEAKEALEENFEEQFDKAGYLMPSYFDLTDELGENSPYDFYITYSICKIDVIRSIAKVNPEAAAFAPCTTMMYKRKDEDKITMGFTAVYNWLSSANITDKESVEGLLKAQKEFEDILIDVTK